jgi:hypothetical protein
MDLQLGVDIFDMRASCRNLCLLNSEIFLIYLDTFYYTKKFRQLKGRLREIEVVVVFHWQADQPNNFVFTAYPA